MKMPFRNKNKKFIEFSKNYISEKEYLLSEDSLFSVFKELEDERVSDYHFEPEEKSVRVKIRFSGKIIEIKEMEKEKYDVLLNKLCIVSDIDPISLYENTDSSVHYRNNNYRISFINSINGISCVIRKLKNIENVEIELPDFLKKRLLENKIESKVYIFSGPTGCGKTTTMSYIINKISEQYKIHTIENPVEYIIKNTVQIEINRKNKNDILKNILRQDPDLIMPGEIRDSDFAKLLINAALTGHSVFATVHSKNVFSSLKRIENLFEYKDPVNDILDIIVNQRLVPIKCTKCGGKGCEYCYGTGTEKLSPVFEILEISHGIKFSEKDDIVRKNLYISPYEQLEKLKSENRISDETFNKTLESFGVII